MNDGRWHISAETNAHNVYQVLAAFQTGFDSKPEAEEQKRRLYVEATQKFDDLWMNEIQLAFPRERAGDVRYTRKAKGEPGSHLETAYKRVATASRCAGYPMD